MLRLTKTRMSASPTVREGAVVDVTTAGEKLFGMRAVGRRLFLLLADQAAQLSAQPLDFAELLLDAFEQRALGFDAFVD